MSMILNKIEGSEMTAEHQKFLASIDKRFVAVRSLYPQPTVTQKVTTTVTKKIGTPSGPR